MSACATLPQSLLLLLFAATSSSLFLPQQQQWDNIGQQTVLEPGASGDRHGAVASENKVCSQIGIDLLALGGNAVDAWIGTQLCVGVTGMYHSGIGGGGFALIRDAHGSYTVVDYRESAPAAAFEDMFKDNVAASVFGGLAAGVPGELRGLEFAHKKFGALAWRAVVEPAAAVARDGFEVNEDMVRYMHGGIKYAGWNFLVEDPSWALDFAPRETLQKVAENGAESFYTGEMAEAIIATIQGGNGTMTLEDLASYQVIARDALKIMYNGFNVYATGSPASGAVSLNTLKVMEGYSSSYSSDVNLTMHRFDEALRFAYGARAELGDPAFVNATAYETLMLDADQAAVVRSMILDNATQPVDHYGLGDSGRGHNNMRYAAPGHGTSHVSTADGQGMAVSSTTTINLLFGNLQMVPSTGVIVNNEMNDFSIPGVRNEFGFEPSEANFVRPGKRPLSSIATVMVAMPNDSSSSSSSRDKSEKPKKETERLLAVIGAAGGSRIISASTQVAWRVVEAALHSDANTNTEVTSMRSAIATPRVHDQLMPNTVVLEEGFDPAVAASLADKGHNVTWVPLAASAVQGVLTRQRAAGGLTL
ncbi:gamma-glutamyltranspeptidase [Astrocystis sublimbata]|nr:gamma-glutamyltranspeptidase [Astrocystis sublimbata]